MKIKVNGDDRELTANTVVAAIDELGLPARALLVEHNGIALRRDEWNAPLSENDRLEIIRIVAGG